MVLKKRGIFFTTTVLVVMTILVASYGLYSYSNQSKNIEKRIITLENFLLSIEEDLPRQVYISGFRSIFLMEKRIAETGIYIDNVESQFKQAFYNGTIYLQEQDLLEDISEEKIEEAVNTKIAKINGNFSWKIQNVSLKQISPWNIHIEVNASIKLEDLSHLAKWEKNITIVTEIPIENFEDPIYRVNTNGKVTKKIIKTPYPDLSSGLNIVNLTDHVKKTYYQESSEAPSFIQKLEGGTQTSIYGIESLVYTPDMSAQGITPLDKSITDHIYFSTSNPGYSQVEGMPSWFKIDAPHLDDYT